MKPGALMGAKSSSAASTIMNRMFKATSKIKMSGSFHGKSNALGHGGRAAQLKARGVPGGVIGNLARAAHTAPGQANYHGKKGAIRKKAFGSMENGGNPAPATMAVKSIARAIPKAPAPMMVKTMAPKVNVSAPTPWTNTATGKALKRSGKKKSSMRKKASKLEMDATYKRKASKKKVARKMSAAECE